MLVNCLACRQPVFVAASRLNDGDETVTCKGCARVLRISPAGEVAGVSEPARGELAGHLVRPPAIAELNERLLHQPQGPNFTGRPAHQPAATELAERLPQKSPGPELTQPPAHHPSHPTHRAPPAPPPVPPPTTPRAAANEIDRQGLVDQPTAPSAYNEAPTGRRAAAGDLYGAGHAAREKAWPLALTPCLPPAQPHAHWAGNTLAHPEEGDQVDTEHPLTLEEGPSRRRWALPILGSAAVAALWLVVSLSPDDLISQDSPTTGTQTSGSTVLAARAGEASQKAPPDDIKERGSPSHNEQRTALAGNEPLPGWSGRPATDSTTKLDANANAVVPRPPRLPPMVGQSAVDHYRRGNLLLAEGKLRLAIEKFRQCLSQQSGFALAYRSLGVAYFRLNQKRKALRAYRRFVELAPGHRDAPAVHDIISKSP